MTVYSYVLLVHIGAVIMSGGLFFSRGLAALLGAGWPRARLVRTLSYAVDTVLLAAALTLVFILPKQVFANHWLSLKLVCVAGYIVLGIAAMRPSMPKSWRWLAFVAGEGLFINIIGIAVTHNPLGWLSLLWP